MSLGSAWARGPRTAGPLLRFSTRNWIPARSVARPMTLSRASISRTRWPLARPPMAGLQDISPMVVRRWVRSRARAPSRADAAAASQPACPPPITITSQELMAAHSREGVQRVQVSRETGIQQHEPWCVLRLARQWRTARDECFS